jgi:signal peptidase I
MNANRELIITRVLTAIILLPLLYLLWLGTRCFVTDYFSIPSYSMFPTLSPGDKVFVNKLTMGARIYTSFNFSLEGAELKSHRMKGLRKVECNDIVVFNFPHHNGKINFVINNVYCKRVVGVPGDSVCTKNGYYQNNNYSGILGVEKMQRHFSETPDSLIPKEVMNTFPFDYHTLCNTKNIQPVYVPRKGDVIKITPREAAYYKMMLEWELSKGITWDWNKNAVYADDQPLSTHMFTHNYYFMAGDNVADSYDSRYWGLVPEEYIVGIVEYVYHGRK